MNDLDPVKDAANFAKHGLSLLEASDMVVLVRVADHRFAEPRFRAYGTYKGEPHCLAYTIRDGEIRPISFRRAHEKEFNRHVTRP